MADLEDVTLVGRPLQFLRMADLKAALKERGLSKSGQKNELVERLKGALVLENLQRISAVHTGLQPNSQIGEKMSQNSFIKQYLAEQQELLRQRLEGEAHKVFETNDQKDNAEVNNSTLCPPQVQDVTPALAEQHKPTGPSGEDGLFGAGNEVEGKRNEEADIFGPPASGSVSMRVSGGEHQLERGSKSSKVAADSDYEDSEDGEEADDDDCDSSARRRSLREPARVPATRERSGESCQPQQQHIPSLLSPQLRQPTPPSSPPPELSFPLPDTPKQSPPSPDVDPGRHSPSTCSSVSYRSCSRGSSPEPQRSGPAERKPGPLTLLAHTMERELALEQERLGCSQARLGRGSPLCEQLREQIVQQFKNNISQRTIARNLGIPPSTVHRIIKRFRESGEISARKGQGRKPTLNAHDLRSFRRHYIKHQHHSVKDRTIWAQEHFGKPLSVNTVRRYIYKCKLMQSECQISTKHRNATGFSSPELI